MPSPTNKKLYAKAKAKVVKKIPKHSAYRSAQIVKEYKSMGGKYSGSKRSGKLTKWFKEDWKNQRGKTGYQKKGDYYRPTKKVDKDTPATHKELSKSEKKKASETKAKGKRIKKFKKSYKK